MGTSHTYGQSKDGAPPTAAALAPTPNLARLRGFIGALGDSLEGVPAQAEEAVILERGAQLLRELIAHDDWLPEPYAAADPARYRQYLLHCDSRQRFSVVSFVWGPGQSTPIHDHTVWGLVGILRGAELNQRFERVASGPFEAGVTERLEAGRVTAVSPRIGDIHRVSNAYADRDSISIHVYGANIGAVQRSTYDATGAAKRFVSGYSNSTLPNLWDRSGEL
jgi:predicted metal-dependent enzyme (double-stranded beta helix superfamily)